MQLPRFMNRKGLGRSLVLTGIGWLLSGSVAAQTTTLEADRRITNAVLSVGISARDAGAVCSLVYDGKELVNDHDHGRQLQVAWAYNDLDEAYNPTEAGADYDGMGPKSTSELVSVRVEGNSLTTESHPAYWRKPGPHCANTTAITRDTLRKTITLGAQGDPHVILFESGIEIASTPTGPAVSKIRIEAPTLYASGGLTDHYLMDRRTGICTKNQIQSTQKDRMNERIRCVTDREQIPILSSPDGRHAIGFYTPQAAQFWSYYTWGVPSDDPANACEKAAVFFQHAVEPGKRYSYRAFLIVGDLQTVKASAMKLHD